ncbi:MAG TPA: MBL fold metallo-hydrolase [Pyrinomonadaceae bacterium]|jgi:glyoxylase-like metal-dependent hydrolase (beta-lactamase superfamily II)/rhodanese-related sulfurtransferase|nr:MBL fold metallo-hydrolase [Pyrinomonadaceae bacterium]
MHFKQFYLNCLAHASYLLGSEGEAAVVDPQRDVDQYLAEAEANGLTIKYVIETHLHADFVSGHQELAERTGAEIVFGKAAQATFPHRPVSDGDELRVGSIRLRILETPGHTPESICVLVIDPAVSAEPQKVLTGDTLFIGDVGRPDLAGGLGYTPQAMAAMMYDSLHNKLLKLDDAVEVYPAHGAGSMCGRSLSSESSSTIGEQRRFNYALNSMSRDEFVSMMTTDLPEAPAYFPRDAEINRSGAKSLDGLSRPAALNPSELNRLITATQTNSLRYTVLDVRSAADFGAGHIPGSLNIGLGGQFAIWAGSLIPLESSILLVAESDEKVEEAIVRLARVGIENVKGYLKGGIKEWIEAGNKLATVPQISVADLRNLLHNAPDLQIIDVRRPPEYQKGHVPNAKHAPLSNLKQELEKNRPDPNRKTAVICAGGYRSSAAASILEPMGFRNLLNVTGGTNAWVEAGYEVEK